VAKVFVDGSEGTTGLRIRERLSGREGIELLLLPDSLRKDPEARRKRMEESDITFLCLPDEAAREAVSFAPESARIIDASTAHRTEPGWQYGFPELGEEFRSGIAKSSRVAVPGCHASGFIALVRPLVKEGILPKDALLSSVSLTGYSGGGKKMIAEYEGEGRSRLLDAARIYASSQNHKHLPEMTFLTGLDRPPVFQPVLADYYAGMLTSVPLHRDQLAGAVTPQELADFYREFYGGPGVLSVLSWDGQNRTLSGNELEGLDTMVLSVEGNAERMTVTARFDNLGKGASGAAVQCMNLMLGLPETEGLKLEEEP